jgi:prepilin-type N-terminal cleavage/methylation domain-containing protein
MFSQVFGFLHSHIVEFCRDNFCGTTIAQCSTVVHSTWTTENFFWIMMMNKHKSKANLDTRPTGRGFSAIELLITVTILSIVTGLSVMGISRAKASVRLSGAAREYATQIEKARVFSIRRHADDAANRASVEINDDKSSYDVTLDLDGDGGMDTRTFTLPGGITFDTVETIAFDWRGRTWSTVGGVTTSNAQVSIRLLSSIDSISIDVTGSGDITIDSQVFDDSVPNVNLKVGDLAMGPTPTPTPVEVVATPTPTPGAISTPDPTVNPDATPTPVDAGDGTTPLPTPSPSPTATPAASPTATPRPSPTATPTPQVCTITADVLAVTLGRDGSTSIKIGHSSSTSLSIDGSSSKPSALQVTPGGVQTVGAGSTTTFTIKSKGSIGVYSVTFSSSCGSKTVPVVVVL